MESNRDRLDRQLDGTLGRGNGIRTALSTRHTQDANSVISCRLQPDPAFSSGNQCQVQPVENPDKRIFPKARLSDRPSELTPLIGRSTLPSHGASSSSACCIPNFAGTPNKA